MKSIRLVALFSVSVVVLALVSAAWADTNASDEPVRCLVKSVDRAEISSEVAGRVVKIPHRAGDSFQKGDILVQFDCALLRAEFVRTQARQAAAAIKVKHDQKLQEFKSVGVLDVELDRAALEVAASETRIAQLAVERCTIAAPFQGRVVQVLVSQYQSVNSQQPLLEILSTRNLELEVMVPSDWLRWLKIGIPFKIQVDETGSEYDAEVVAVGAAVDPVSKMVLVRGGLKTLAPDLVPGMGAAAYFKAPLPPQ